MNKTLIIGMILLIAVAMIIPVSAMNPHDGTTGQPSQSCQDCFPSGILSPQGFNTLGFAHAGTVYAGSDGTPSLLHGNFHAVSQYDVACFQQLNRPHR